MKNIRRTSKTVALQEMSEFEKIFELGLSNFNPDDYDTQSDMEDDLLELFDKLLENREIHYLLIDTGRENRILGRDFPTLILENGKIVFPQILIIFDEEGVVDGRRQVYLNGDTSREIFKILQDSPRGFYLKNGILFRPPEELGMKAFDPREFSLNILDTIECLKEQNFRKHCEFVNLESMGLYSFEENGKIKYLFKVVMKGEGECYKGFEREPFFAS